MNNSILDCVIPLSGLVGEDEEDTKLLFEMTNDAVTFIQSFRWCPKIKGQYFGGGVGGLIGVFLFNFDQPISESDEWLWVIVGDLPSAYFVIDQAMTGADALRAYCKLMNDWCQAVLTNTTLQDVFPVKAAATPENAKSLIVRLKFIHDKIIPITTCESLSEMQKKAKQFGSQ